MTNKTPEEIIRKQIVQAVQNGDYALVQKLLNKRKKPDYEQLITAIENGNHKELEALLKAHLNPNDRKPSEKLLDGLSLDCGYWGDVYLPPKYSAPGPRPLDVALQIEDAKAVGLLLNYGAQCDNPKKITEFREQLKNKRFFNAVLKRNRNKTK